MNRVLAASPIDLPRLGSRSIKSALMKLYAKATNIMESIP